MEWKPPSVEEVKKIVERELANCDREQLAIFGRYAVEPYLAPILRYGEMDNVVVVARKGEEVIYWEDVEEDSTFHRQAGVGASWSTCVTRTN
jgi:hypothetical protein